MYGMYFTELASFQLLLPVRPARILVQIDTAIEMGGQACLPVKVATKLQWSSSVCIIHTETEPNPSLSTGRHSKVVQPLHSAVFDALQPLMWIAMGH
jgi:hypothetical protein